MKNIVAFLLLFFCFSLHGQNDRNVITKIPEIQILDSLKTIEFERWTNQRNVRYFGPSNHDWNNKFGWLITEKKYDADGIPVDAISNQDALGMALLGVSKLLSGTSIGETDPNDPTYILVDTDNDYISMNSNADIEIGRESPLPLDGTDYAQIEVNSAGGQLILNASKDISIFTGDLQEHYFKIASHEGYTRKAVLTVFPVLTQGANGAKILYEKELNNGDTYITEYQYNHPDWIPTSSIGLPRFSNDTQAGNNGLTTGEWWVLNTDPVWGTPIQKL